VKQTKTLLPSVILQIAQYSRSTLYFSNPLPQRPLSESVFISFDNLNLNKIPFAIVAIYF